MKIILTPQQKQQLEEMHDSTRDDRVRDRIKAVLLASEGLGSDDDVKKDTTTSQREQELADEVAKLKR